MLELQFREASLLKKLTDSLKDIAKEVNVFCRYEDVTLQTMDESHVALIALKLQSAALAHYRCDSECVLGLDIGILHKFISPFSNDQPLILRRAEGENVVTIVGSSVKQGKVSTKSNKKTNDENSRTTKKEDDEVSSEDDNDPPDDEGSKQSNNAWNRTVKVKLIVVEQSHYATPENIQFASEVFLPCNVFSNVVRGNSGVSETLKLTAKPTTFEFSVDTELGHTSSVFHKGVGVLKNEKEFPWRWQKSASGEDDNVVMEVALAYMQKFIKACALSPKVCVSMSVGIPLRLRFPIPEFHGDAPTYGRQMQFSSFLEFYLAPKVGDDDEI